MVSAHAADELEDCEIDIQDLEGIILTGEVVERRVDKETREHLFRGVTASNASGCAVAKFDSVGRAVFITVFLGVTSAPSAAPAA